MNNFEFKLIGWCKDNKGNVKEFTEDQVKSITWVSKN